ncbi:hypothetical protein A3B32_03300 [Candidatus Uhrbacteria bacterium RIFCSPLOWO2_01_FULL_53_9]|uniref:Uncharacterized protein n=3 Tax=Candidatus Uhriibacteriota TaxID=1752732 RepID=A0A1F7UYH8_9BACT|nr:MAG: hypothetical protein A3C17_03700 [Candidatus Uhrbacteria bacterium RIFCSPHIGHO2_02_FULL_53_13]OGL83313.1 MAG: hypothetical protein A3B32_03300 [Candidatus Uhrbacteria bacterium RIFCSPLOWO2_01_FULL_53_9]OGL90186.1 MAG: hypothetical protein A3I45_02400 [Candidatus Uhrbacteria bacterium RIFCSPLOWO2_02_FULL_53_10]
MKQRLQRFMRAMSREQLKAATWTAGFLALASLFVPDALPFVDEIGLLWVFSELVLECRARASKKRGARDV